MSDSGAMTPRNRAMKITALVIMVVGVAADLWTKSYMQDLLGLRSREPGDRVVEVVPGFFRFEGLWNPGVTFGLAQGWTQTILVFTVVASLGILAWMLLTRS